MGVAADLGAGAAETLPGAASSLQTYGNPLGEERAKRDAWAGGLNVKPFTEGMEILYFVGCYYSYDPRNMKVARATARILEAAGVEVIITDHHHLRPGAGQEFDQALLPKIHILIFVNDQIIVSTAPTA